MIHAWRTARHLHASGKETRKVNFWTGGLKLNWEKWRLLRERSEHHKRWLVSTYLNRPFSNVITYFLLDRDVTPNQISAFTSLFSLLVFLAYSTGNFILGGVLTQVTSIIDGVDGEVARAKNLCSEIGGVLDSIFDRFAEIMICTGIAIGVSAVRDAYTAWLFSAVGVIGFLIDAYIAELVKARTGRPLHGTVKRIEEKLRFSPSDRGMKLMIIFILSLLGLPEWGVLLVGLISIFYAVAKLYLWLADQRG